MSALTSQSRCADVVKFYPDGAAALAGGTTILTGPTAGIGVATATALASLGGRLVLAARSAEKAAAVSADILAKHPTAKVSCIHLDLMSLVSVADFLREFRQKAQVERWPPLKCLVLNAGLISLKHTLSTDCYEATFAVSHLAHFLLATELRPELKQAAPSRIVIVSSGSHAGPYATKNLRSVEALKEHVVNPPAAGWGLPRAIQAYGNAKLCNTMMARSIAEKLAGDGISSCSLHPGTMMGTSIVRDSGVLNFFMRHVLSWFTKDMDQGSSTTLACCLAPHEALLGGFWSDCRLTAHASLVNDARAREVLWELSNELCAAQRVGF